MHDGTPRARLLPLNLCFLTLLIAAVLSLLAAAPAARAQVAVYGSFTSSRLAGGPGGDFLYGATAGLLLDGPGFLHRVVLSGDLQTRAVGLDGERLMTASIGPRLSLAVPRLNLTPYAEFLIGFGRYRPSVAPGSASTTDSLWQTNFGASRPLNSHLDATVEYGYSQFGYDDGQYNPKHFSAGLMFHFLGR